MATDRTSVLLVSEDPADTSLVRQALDEDSGSQWHLLQHNQLSDAITCLQQNDIAAVLLDLTLPDSQGLNTFEVLFKAVPWVPILVLVNRDNEETALKATQGGAYDYLLKEHLDAYWIPRLLHSVIQRKATEDALFLEKERAQVTLNSIGDAVLTTDIAGEVNYLNKVAEGMTGWSCPEAVGRPLTDVFQIIDGTTRETAPNPMTRAVEENRIVGLSANCILIRRDGVESAIEDSAAPIRDRRGKVIGAVIVFHDKSMARSVVKKMSHLAHHDSLTELPNRLLFRDRVSHAVAIARRHSRQCAVLFIDLDGFKHINDVNGHALGDKLLQSIAKRLKSCVRGSDTVGRQGGDEFVILLAEINSPDDAARFAEKLLATMRTPYKVDGEMIHIPVSIGISVFPADGADADKLLNVADSAMYHVKDAGGNNYSFINGDMTGAVKQLDFSQKSRVSE